MNDFRAALDRELGAPPRCAVDVDAVIERQRTRGRLRVAVLVGSAAAAVAGLVVGMMALIGVAVPPGTSSTGSAGEDSVPPAPSAPHPGCTPPARPSPTPSPSPWITGDPTPTAAPNRPDPALPAGAGPRLTTALKAAVRAAVGRPKVAGSNWGTVRRPLEFNTGPCDPKDFREYMAAASVLTRTEPRVHLGDMFVIVTVVGTRAGPDAPVRTRCRGADVVPEPNETACQVSRGPRGESVLAVTWHGDRQGMPPATWHDVTVSKPDGTLVTLHCGGAGPDHPTPPVTVTQLIAIGLDPRLTLAD
jgi:hypothetical protein